MHVRYLGHACFVVESERGLRVLLDPYRPGALGGRITHGPIDIEPDLVAVTHYHEDHGWIGGVPGTPTIVDRPGRFCGVRFAMTWLPHDGCGGSHMGLSRAIRLVVDGVSVLHLGDLGRSLTPDELLAIGRRVDVLLLPVGGTFTLPLERALELQAALRPRWTVPMHYRSPRVNLDMAPREDYLRALPRATRVRVPSTDPSALECPVKSRRGAPEVVLLEPAL